LEDQIQTSITLSTGYDQRRIAVHAQHFQNQAAASTRSTRWRAAHAPCNEYFNSPPTEGRVTCSR
jgi:hypothetical protein